jgi:hypothetical protein
MGVRRRTYYRTISICCQRSRGSRSHIVHLLTDVRSFRESLKLQCASLDFFLSCNQLLFEFEFHGFGIGNGPLSTTNVFLVEQYGRERCGKQPTSNQYELVVVVIVRTPGIQTDNQETKNVVFGGGWV